MPEQLNISKRIRLPLAEISLNFIRVQGAGGQNVNKVSTAVHLRFSISASSLPESCKTGLLAMKDHHITADGIIIIKAQTYRSQEKNRADALDRLAEIICRSLVRAKKRKATKPSRNSQKKRMDSKTKHGNKKVLRGKIKGLD